MSIILKAFLFLTLSQNIDAGLKVENIVVRTPRPNDVGLIIDLTFTNDVDDESGDYLDLSVSSAEPCLIYTNPNQNDTFKGGYIIGGDIGCIEAGATDTVSLVLPTDSPFNRVGCCPVVITSTNSNSEQFHMNETIRFNTSFPAIDPDSTSLRRSKNYRDCNNYDLDYLNNCKPVNCEARYFGLRNFFNVNSKRCEEIPRCEGRMFYDALLNECIDPSLKVSQKVTRDTKPEKYKDYDDYLDMEDGFDALESFPTLETREENQKREIPEFAVDVENNNDPKLVISETAYLVKGILDGLILVVATIAVYVLICFSIFMIVSWISKRQGGHDATRFPITPSVSDSIRLPSSCTLFQRMSMER